MFSDDEIYNAIEKLVEAHKCALTRQERDDVLHYLRHDEPEIAFEGLFLDLMGKGNITISKNADDYMEMARQLLLDKENVFDNDFWDKLKLFLGKSAAA